MALAQGQSSGGSDTRDIPFGDPIRVFGIVIKDISEQHRGEVIHYEELEGTANEANDRAEELLNHSPHLHGSIETVN